MAFSQDVIAEMGLDTRDFDKKLKSSKSKVKKFAAAAAKWLGGVALVDAGRRALEFATQLERASSQTGLNVELLQKLQKAGARYGIQQDMVNDTLEEFSIRINDAAEGTGPAAEGFKQLGINVRNSEGNIRATKDLLLDVSEGLSNIENRSTRVQIADKIFGGQAAQTLRLLEQGRDRLQEIAEAGNKPIVSEENIQRLDKSNSLLKETIGDLKSLGLGLAGEVLKGLGNLSALLVGGPFQGELQQRIKEDREQQKQIAKMAQELKEKRRETADQQERVSEAQKAATDSAEADSEAQKRKTAELKAQRQELERQRKEQAALQKDLRDAQKRLQTARLDRVRFNVQDLAQSNLFAARQAGAPDQFFEDVQSARQVRALQQRAERAKQLGRLDIAQQSLSRADQIRSGILALRESERKPFAALEQQVKQLDTQISALKSIDQSVKPLRTASNAE